MANKISALVKRPGCPPRHVWVSNSLEALQRAVEGYIECITRGEFVVICDEEGLIKGKEYNCTIFGYHFVGDIVIVGRGLDKYGNDTGELVDLPYTWEDIKEIFPQLFGGTEQC